MSVVWLFFHCDLEPELLHPDDTRFSLNFSAPLAVRVFKASTLFSQEFRSSTGEVAMGIDATLHCLEAMKAMIMAVGYLHSNVAETKEQYTTRIIHELICSNLIDDNRTFSSESYKSLKRSQA